MSARGHGAARGGPLSGEEVEEKWIGSRILAAPPSDVDALPSAPSVLTSWMVARQLLTRKDTFDVIPYLWFEEEDGDSFIDPKELLSLSFTVLDEGEHVSREQVYNFMEDEVEGESGDLLYAGTLLEGESGRVCYIKAEAAQLGRDVLGLLARYDGGRTSRGIVVNMARIEAVLKELLAVSESGRDSMQVSLIDLEAAAIGSTRDAVVEEICRDLGVEKGEGELTPPKMKEIAVELRTRWVKGGAMVVCVMVGKARPVMDAESGEVVMVSKVGEIEVMLDSIQTQLRKSVREASIIIQTHGEEVEKELEADKDKVAKEEEGREKSSSSTPPSTSAPPSSVTLHDVLPGVLGKRVLEGKKSALSAQNTGKKGLHELLRRIGGMRASTASFFEGRWRTDSAETMVRLARAMREIQREAEEAGVEEGEAADPSRWRGEKEESEEGGEGGDAGGGKKKDAVEVDEDAISSGEGKIVLSVGAEVAQDWVVAGAADVKRESEARKGVQTMFQMVRSYAKYSDTKSYDVLSGSPSLRGGGVPVGLANMGQTCYLNAVLQALFFVPPVRARVLHSELEPAIRAARTIARQRRVRSALRRGTLALALRRLFAELTLSARSAVAPGGFIEEVAAVEAADGMYGLSGKEEEEEEGGEGGEDAGETRKRKVLREFSLADFFIEKDAVEFLEWLVPRVDSASHADLHRVCAAASSAAAASRIKRSPSRSTALQASSPTSASVPLPSPSSSPLPPGSTHTTTSPTGSTTPPRRREGEEGKGSRVGESDGDEKEEEEKEEGLEEMLQSPPVWEVARALRQERPLTELLSWRVIQRDELPPKSHDDHDDDDDGEEDGEEEGEKRVMEVGEDGSRVAVFPQRAFAVKLALVSHVEGGDGRDVVEEEEEGAVGVDGAGGGEGAAGGGALAPMPSASTRVSSTVSVSPFGRPRFVHRPLEADDLPPPGYGLETPRTLMRHSRRLLRASGTTVPPVPVSIYAALGARHGARGLCKGKPGLEVISLPPVVLLQVERHAHILGDPTFLPNPCTVDEELFLDEWVAPFGAQSAEDDGLVWSKAGCAAVRVAQHALRAAEDMLEQAQDAGIEGEDLQPLVETTMEAAEQVRAAFRQHAKCRYSLRAAVIHRGASPAAGHYFAVLRFQPPPSPKDLNAVENTSSLTAQPGSSSSSSSSSSTDPTGHPEATRQTQWVVADDAKVTTFDDEKAPRYYLPGGEGRVNRAQLLVYTRYPEESEASLARQEETLEEKGVGEEEVEEEEEEDGEEGGGAAGHEDAKATADTHVPRPFESCSGAAVHVRASDRKAVEAADAPSMRVARLTDEIRNSADEDLSDVAPTVEVAIRVFASLYACRGGEGVIPGEVLVRVLGCKSDREVLALRRSVLGIGSILMQSIGPLFMARLDPEDLSNLLLKRLGDSLDVKDLLHRGSIQEAAARLTTEAGGTVTSSLHQVAFIVDKLNRIRVKGATPESLMKPDAEGNNFPILYYPLTAYGAMNESVDRAIVRELSVERLKEAAMRGRESLLILILAVAGSSPLASPRTVIRLAVTPHSCIQCLHHCEELDMNRTRVFDNNEVRLLQKILGPLDPTLAKLRGFRILPEPPLAGKVLKTVELRHFPIGYIERALSDATGEFYRPITSGIQPPLAYPLRLKFTPTKEVDGDDGHEGGEGDGEGEVDPAPSSSSSSTTTTSEAVPSGCSSCVGRVVLRPTARDATPGGQKLPVHGPEKAKRGFVPLEEAIDAWTTLEEITGGDVELMERCVVHNEVLKVSTQEHVNKAVRSITLLKNYVECGGTLPPPGVPNKMDRIRVKYATQLTQISAILTDVDEEKALTVLDAARGNIEIAMSMLL